MSVRSALHRVLDRQCEPGLTKTVGLKLIRASKRLLGTMASAMRPEVIRFLVIGAAVQCLLFGLRPEGVPWTIVLLPSILLTLIVLFIIIAFAVLWIIAKLTQPKEL